MNFANAYQGQALSLANTPELNEFAMNSLTAFQALSNRSTSLL
ncbi:MAG: hypothetical protein ACLR7U_01565 [Ruthenibacterium lactatiformans]